MTKRLLAGTSGYSYREWLGSFYPPKFPTARMLTWYAARFPSVELNNSFYKLPTAKAFATWAGQVPARFTFAVKAPGRITHAARLGPKAAAPTRQLFRTIDTLGPRLGPVLFGLPPNMKKDLPRLVDFLERLPPKHKVAFEFRHETWLTDDVFAALAERDVALCIADAEELTVPFEATASWGYLRLRRAGYDEAALSQWAARVAAARWTRAWCFFKHEDEGVVSKLAAAFTACFAALRPASPAPSPGPASPSAPAPSDPPPSRSGPARS